MPNVTSAKLGFRPLRAVGLLSVVLTLCFGSSAFAEDVVKTFSISAGPAETTLKAFSEQSGRSVMFATEKVKGVTTNELRGELPISDALDRLLSGTKLSAVPEPQSGGFAIRREVSVEQAEKKRLKPPGR